MGTGRTCLIDWLFQVKNYYCLLPPLLFVTTFTHGIYNNIPKTNHVYRVRRFAAILQVQFLLHVLLLLLFVMNLVRGICNYVFETQYVCRVHNVVGILWLQFTTHLMSFPTINIFYFHIRIFRSTVHCAGVVFIAILLSVDPWCCIFQTLLRYCLNDSDMVTVAPSHSCFYTSQMLLLLLFVTTFNTGYLQLYT